MLQIGSKYKIARRLGPIFEKTQTQKFVVRQQRIKPSGKGKKGTPSEFNKQLIEKQKLRYTYGLKERKLSSYVTVALGQGKETIKKLFSLLESRLDSVAYRAGFADTRRHARQLVSHGHVVLNGRKNNVASTQVKVGDVITVRSQSQGKTVFEAVPARKKEFKTPAWLKLDGTKLEATIAAEPTADHHEFDFKKIIEFYTR